MGATLTLKDWLVMVPRELAEQAGVAIPDDRGGPYVTVAVFTGEDAEHRAGQAVKKLQPLMGTDVWAWSGEQVLRERAHRQAANS